VKQENLDCASAHDLDEPVELLLGAAEPDDVVEQQLMAVGRREPFMRKVRTVDDHSTKRSDL
jgi:hypothetical protein